MRQWVWLALLAGGVAVSVAVGWLVAPGASGQYWRHLLWQTRRVGDIAFVGNQSLAGAVARAAAPSFWWAVLVIAVLGVWAWRVQGGEEGHRDAWAGLALTGVVMCLVSPITWVHHLVWQLPALLVLAGQRGSGYRLVAAAVFALMATGLVWLFAGGSGPGSDLHVLTGLVLLFVVPVGRQRAAGQP